MCINRIDETMSCTLPRLDIREDGPNVAAIIATLWPRRHSRRRSTMDIRDLPDHILRDIGMLDGNRPTGGVRW